MEDNLGSAGTRSTLAVNQVLTIVALIFALGSLIAAIYLASISRGLAEKNAAQEELILEQVQKIENLHAETERHVNGMRDLRTNVFLLYFQHEASGSVATEDFVAKTVRVAPTDGNKLHAVIDVDVQPATEKLYIGSGQFDIPDRDLRAMCEGIIAKVKDQYGDVDRSAPQWDDSNVILSIRNFEIGNTKSGQFKFVGEK